MANGYGPTPASRGQGHTGSQSRGPRGQTRPGRRCGRAARNLRRQRRARPPAGTARLQARRHQRAATGQRQHAAQHMFGHGRGVHARDVGHQHPVFGGGSNRNHVDAGAVPHRAHQAGRGGEYVVGQSGPHHHHRAAGGAAAQRVLRGVGRHHHRTEFGQPGLRLRVDRLRQQDARWQRHVSARAACSRPVLRHGWQPACGAPGPEWCPAATPRRTCGNRRPHP